MLSITNYTDLQIYFVAQYNTKQGTKTRQSATFGRSVCKKMYFESTIKNLAFNVINDSSPNKDLICNRYLGDAKIYNFYVVEASTGIMCVQD